MHSTRVTLSTRHGIRPSKTNFSTCKWDLPDPIFAPSQDYTLHADVTFVAIPDDHNRISYIRGTSRLRFLTETTDVNNNTVTTFDHSVSIQDGMYSRRGYLAAISMAVNEDISIRYQNVANQANYITMKPATDSNDVDLECYHANEVENIVICVDTNDFSTNYNLRYKVVHDGVHNGSEVLGIHDTTDWIDHSVKNMQADSLMDTHGTRTITINAMGLSGNHPDPVDRYRRRCTLRVIPADNNIDHTMHIWERKGGKDGHPISSRCLTMMELSLFDDMGFPYDPRHHWAVSLEIYAARSEHFNLSM